MKIAICDDIETQVEMIKQSTIKYFKDIHQTVHIDTFNQVFTFLDAHDKSPYDLVLLDIVMPGLLGTEAAREIRLKPNKTEIIFLTTSNEFAVDAFEVNASHYLLKPYPEATFNQALSRALSRMEQKQSKTVLFKGAKGVLIPMDKDLICYIEANSHRQVVIQMDGKSVEIVQTMTDIFNRLETLSTGQFIQPYKGFIVNQRAIAAIESDRIVLKNGVHIPLARRTYHLVKQAYFDYMFGGRE